MAEALKDQMARPDMDDLAFEERFAMLVDAQYLFRENKRMKRLLENAKLKISASMEDVDYRTPRGLDKSVLVKPRDLRVDTEAPERHHRRTDRHGQDLPCLRPRPQGLQGRNERLLHADAEALLHARHGAGGRELREGACEARQDLAPRP